MISGDTSKVNALPKVKKLAEEMQIDITKVTGTGPGGRILEEDLEAFKNQPVATSDSKVAVKPIDASRLGKDETKKLSAIQRAMVSTMKVANSIPHFGYCEEYNMNKLVELRKNLKDAIKKEYGISLSYMPFIIKACSMALNEYPMLNASVNWKLFWK